MTSSYLATKVTTGNCSSGLINLLASSLPWSAWLLTCLSLCLLLWLSWAETVLAAPQKQPTLSAPSTNDWPTLQSNGKVSSDAVYRYLADKGSQYFRRGKFVEAERYFQAALADAKVAGVHDKPLAMLLTNLATDLREEQKFDEAEPLFQQAVTLERSMPKNDQALNLYTGRQYAALLRQTDRDETAAAMLALARSGFENLHSNHFSVQQNDDENVDDASVLGSPREAMSNERSAASRTEGNFEPFPGTRTETTVTAQLKELAEIEKVYADESRGSPSAFPSMTFDSFAVPFTFGAEPGQPLPLFTPIYVPPAPAVHASIHFGRAGVFHR